MVLLLVNGKIVWMISAKSHDEAAELAKREAKVYANQLNADPRHIDAVDYRNEAEFALRSCQ